MFERKPSDSVHQMLLVILKTSSLIPQICGVPLNIVPSRRLKRNSFQNMAWYPRRLRFLLCFHNGQTGQ